jgi:hypothetical protein
MAAAQSQGLRETVELQPNVPVELALKYPTGKSVSGVNGERVMFSLQDGRVLFLDLGPAQKINALHVKPGEPFSLCLQWSGKRGDPKELVAWLSTEAEKTRALGDAAAAGDTWTAKKLRTSIARTQAAKVAAEPRAEWVAPDVGEQGDGTLRVPVAAGSTSAAPAAGACGPLSNIDARISQDPLMPWALFLLGQTKQMIAVYGAALAYAQARYGTTVGPADVMALLLAALPSGKGGADVC